jgi:hypothetical protein
MKQERAWKNGHGQHTQKEKEGKSGEERGERKKREPTRSHGEFL